ncbi:tyrosine-type recombinase/integrase [Novosphingobium rosa]|uniref:tyrosine-type recombinase/integrase n=1 Tax=Novosphingobium rosa TaxID=76978 RepID=UPI000A015D06|nr:integrase arm-type DNA-binding domain-containing protein [Novosphingobium rosa]
MLNDAKIRAAKPAAKSYKLTDGSSLYLLVTPSGSKIWKWNYTYDGKQRTMGIGGYPLFSLLAARASRDEARLLLGQGKDPVVEKRLNIEANLKNGRCTFERVAREWHAELNGQWARKHALDVMRSLERDVFPMIGNLPIAQLTSPAVLEVLRSIEARGAIETAKRVRQRISMVFIYAIANGVAVRDPAEKLGAILKPLRKRRQPAITDIKQLSTMIDDAESDYARPITRLALRLLALTAVRPNELRGARWEEFEDLNGAEPLWRIPASRMKGSLDRKEEVGGDHLVPLVPQSVMVLRAVWPLSGGGLLVFPSTRNAHKPMSENTIGYLLNRAGYHGHHVPHGFRAAFSTIMNEWAQEYGQKGDRAIIDLMLAHVPANKVEGAYNRARYMKRRREIAAIWADMLTKDLPPPGTLLIAPAREESGACTWRRIPVPLPKKASFPELAKPRNTQIVPRPSKRARRAS